VEFNFRKYAELRMRLLPYYNTLGHESHIAGMPLMRPLLFEFDNDEHLRGVDDQIMLGGNLMICPVIQSGARSRKIVLPAGQWHDFWSERSWQGKISIEYSAPLDRLPILVKGGSILPMGPVLQHIPDGHVFNHLELHIWPPYPAEGIFFDDDGQTCAYLHGAFSRTRLRAEQVGKQLLIRISAAQGTFEGQLEKREIEIILHLADEIKCASVNQRPVQVSNKPGPVRIGFEHTTNRDSLVEITFAK
jgi:alpha-glucosidase